MPNHVKNSIKASSEVLKSMINESGRVDFSLVIPSFDDGFENGISCNAESIAECCVKFDYNPDDFMSRFKLSNLMRDDVKDLSDDCFDAFIKMLKNYREYGYFHCMDFNRKEWGTKWNAYEEEIGELELKFETAWSHPEPVIKKLSEKFPDEEITVLYADEDLGNNLGSYVIKNGEKIYINKIENETEFAAKLHYGEKVNPKDFGYDENWIYVEE